MDHDDLHHEIDRLPEKYRLPIILCYMQGRTQPQAAQMLGWPLGTVQIRLHRGRERLRSRLSRAGTGLFAVTGSDLAKSLSVSRLHSNESGSTHRSRRGPVRRRQATAGLVAAAGERPGELGARDHVCGFDQGPRIDRGRSPARCRSALSVDRPGPGRTSPPELRPSKPSLIAASQNITASAGRKRSPKLRSRSSTRTTGRSHSGSSRPASHNTASSRTGDTRRGCSRPRTSSRTIPALESLPSSDRFRVSLCLIALG